MIIKALADYYGLLLNEASNDSVARPGWTTLRVNCMLEIDENGSLLNVIPAADKKGWSKPVPAQVKRTSGIAANFLCDKADYFLGVSESRADRSLLCFEASRSRHRELLGNVDSPCARAIVAFFDSWIPEKAELNAAFLDNRDILLAGSTLVFCVRNHGDPTCDQAIIAAWENQQTDTSNEAVSTCLVTGKRTSIARLHPSIKGVYGGQPSGTSLVAFNQPAFESYGCNGMQGLNAPIGINTTHEYTTALNHLLDQREHTTRLGDTTIVYWSQSKFDREQTSAFSMLIGNMGKSEQLPENENARLNSVIRHLAKGACPVEEDLDFDAPFFVAGLAPNVAMLSVRFFYQGSFGSVVSNLVRHYERLDIAHAPYERDVLTPYMVLQEIENANSSKPIASSELGGALMRSILQDDPYPEGLYQNALLRIRTTRKVTRGRAAIIKAYLLKNRGYSKEEITVSLNEDRNETAYSLGRAFSILEQIQERANDSSNIASRYLDSACTTPGMVFPTLLKLGTAHLTKIGRQNPGLAKYYQNMLGDVLQQSRVEVFPKRLTLVEQGDFFLGYYHQNQRRYGRASSENETSAEVGASEVQEG